jgi:hypothetical protein
VDAVRRVMKACMTTSVAIKFNWFGKGGKERFLSLRLKDVVFGKCFIMQDCKID